MQFRMVFYVAATCAIFMPSNQHLYQSLLSDGIDYLGKDEALTDNFRHITIFERNGFFM